MISCLDEGVQDMTLFIGQCGLHPCWVFPGTVTLKCWKVRFLWPLTLMWNYLLRWLCLGLQNLRFSSFCIIRAGRDGFRGVQVVIAPLELGATNGVSYKICLKLFYLYFSPFNLLTYSQTKFLPLLDVCSGFVPESGGKPINISLASLLQNYINITMKHEK